MSIIFVNKVSIKLLSTLVLKHTYYQNMKVFLQKSRFGTTPRNSRRPILYGKFALFGTRALNDVSVSAWALTKMKKITSLNLLMIWCDVSVSAWALTKVKKLTALNLPMTWCDVSVSAWALTKMKTDVLMMWCDVLVLAWACEHWPRWKK